MKCAIITPPTLLGHVIDTKYNLILAHWLNNPSYAEYYAHPGSGFVIMDNGAAEGELLEDWELLKLAITGQKPSVLVCPDTLGDGKKTLKQIRDFKTRAAYHFGALEYWGVAQGSTYEEVRESAFKLLDSETYYWLDGICLPRLMTNFHSGWFNRARLAMELEAKLDGRMLHCLGSGTWVQEAQVLASIPWVTGIDTSSPIVMGLLGLDIEKSNYPGRTGLKTPYPATPLENYQADQKLIDHNINTYLSWCRSK